MIAATMVVGPATATHDPSAQVVIADSGAGFATIQAAINAASAGDTLLVRAGTYDEALLVNKAITICSAAPREAHCAGDPVGDLWSLQGAAWAADPADADSQALRIQTAADQGFGVASLALPDGTRIQDLTALEFDAYYETGGCAGGSPRYAFSVDTNGDGASDKTLNVYGGPAPSYSGCPLGAWKHNDLMDGAPRWDAQSMGGPFYGTQAQAAAAAGPAHELLSVRLIWDSPWAFPSQTEVSYFDNLRVNNVLLMEPSNFACNGEPSTDPGCPDGMLTSTIDGAGGIYPVFITADDVVLRDLTIQNPTFTTVDVGATKVDPSLVVVYGADNVEISDNVLQFPASPLPPGTSRWITDGVNVAMDGSDRSDNVLISGNVFRAFTESAGTPGVCTNAPCRTAAIDLWGVGSTPSIIGNDMTLPAGDPDGSGTMMAGIWANAVGATIRGNTIASEGNAVAGLYAIKGAYQSSTFEANSFSGALHGIFVSGSGLTIAGNEFDLNNEGLRITAKDSTIEGNSFTTNNIGIRVAGPSGPPEATDLVFRENVFTQNTRALSIHEQVDGVHFDARENDWGVYETDQIALFLEDAGTDNTIDISCFIDEDGTTRVCPIAAISKTVSTGGWPRTVTLVDASTFPGSEFASRSWTLSVPPSSSAAQSIVLSLGPGAYSFGLTVTDAEGFTSSASDSLFLVNTPPAFDVADNHAATENVPFALTLGATDAESDTVTYTLTGAPAGATVVAGVLQWTPTYAQSGSYTFSISASDGLATTTDSLTIDVANVAAGPVIDPIAHLNLLVGNSGSRNVKANSPGNSPITLAATGGPAGATFVDNGDGQGTFSYSAPAGSTGTYPVTIEATSEGITTTKVFNVVVTSSVGLTFTRVTPTIVQTVPGATVLLNGTIQNTGTGSDAFRVTGVSSKAGWTLLPPANIPLAAGETGAVSFAVTLPASGDLSFVTVKVCSVASPTTCQQLAWRVEVPLIVTIDMENEFGLLDEVGGMVVVKFVNGEVAPDVSVIVTETSDEGLPLLESAAEGSTDPSGTFAFVLDDARASFIGGHSVFVSAKRGSMQAVKTDHYDITP